MSGIYASAELSPHSLFCQLCARKFTSHAALKRHTESKHTHSNINYVCNVCDKSFKTKWSLSTHTSRFHRKLTTAVVQAADMNAAIDKVNAAEQQLQHMTNIDWVKSESRAKNAGGSKF